MATNTMSTLSSLELMLEQIQKRDDQPKDVPPPLPTRPVIRARLPRSRSRLPFSSQKNDCKETEDPDMSSGLVGSLFDGKSVEFGDFIDSSSHLRSSNRIGSVAGPAFQVESVNGSIEGFGSRNSEDGLSEKIGNFNDAEEATLQQIIGIHGQYYGRQTCFCSHELDRGVITLQSFIRGDNARKFFTKKMTAIGVIQKVIRGQLRSRILEEEEDHAVIYLQASIRGWLAWRHFNSIDRKEKQLTGDAMNVKTLEKKDQVEVPYSVLVDLQRRVLKTEALLDEKKEENASLRLQIKELERKSQQYETQMKSMEKTWQDQLTSIQANLAAAKKSSSSNNAVGKLGLLFALPENHYENAHDSPLKIRSRLNSDQFIHHHRKAMSDGSAHIPIQNEQVHQSTSSTDPEEEEELHKLRLKFKTWKKDFKNRLVVAKTTIKKLGNSEAAGRTSHKKWWGRQKKKRDLDVFS